MRVPYRNWMGMKRSERRVVLVYSGLNAIGQWHTYTPASVLGPALTLFLFSSCADNIDVDMLRKQRKHSPVPHPSPWAYTRTTETKRRTSMILAPDVSRKVL